MAQQSSRLHRLLTLLDTGSTQATRFAAARQIGDIAKSHPQDLSSLLSKVSQYLHSKSWETRVAAAHAIGAIAESVKHESLPEIYTCVETKMSEARISGAVQDVMTCHDPRTNPGSSFRSFELTKVLEFGTLVASGGQEYDIASDNSKNPRERLARQKQNLKRRLGLDVCEQFMDMNDMIRDEDLLVHKMDSPGDRAIPQFYMPRPVQQFVVEMVPSFRSRRPSARERNLLKRKAKISSKDQAKGWPDAEGSNSQDIALPKGFSTDSSVTNALATEAILEEDSFEHDEDGVWPFESFVEQLILDMFDPVWEVRHGSVMALREILTHQGASVGVLKPGLSVGGAPFIDSKDKIAVKRERNIDLNMQVNGDDCEPIVKKQKLENTSCDQMDPMTSTRNGIKVESNITVENGECDLAAQSNGELLVSSIKVEPQSNLEHLGYSCEGADLAETKSFSHDRNSTVVIDVLKYLPESSDLMNFIKCARHSSLKNSEFLQDYAIRFLCVLSLDRFGDYVSDQVVAPVRETCAQALGAAIKYMHPTLVHETLNVLMQMQHRPEWEVRHGSLLGIKYLVAVRQEMLPDLLGCVLPACKAGLEDPDDDVRAVAADALIPTAALIVSLKGQMLHTIVMLLWDILLDLDDLSPSTSSVMNLLAEIYSQDQMIPKATDEQGFDLNEIVDSDDLGDGNNSQENPYMLSILAPRLWPFMRHSITSVRYSAIRTLERLLEAGYRRSISESSSSFWPSFILVDTLRIVFQNMLLESNPEIMQCSERVWRLLLQCPVEDLETAARSYISSWIELATTPYGSPLDATKMFWPLALPRKSHFKAAAKMRAVKLENGPRTSIPFDSSEGNIIQESNGDASSVPVKIVVGADTETSVTHTRVVTAKALGLLASKLKQVSVQYILEPLWRAITSMSGVQRQVASMVIISWFKEMKSSISSSEHAIPGNYSNLKNQLLSLLACTDPAYLSKDSISPYVELSRTYGKMRNEASQLRSVIESCGLADKLSSGKFDPDNITPDDALTFASNLPPVSSDVIVEESGGRNIVDELESLKQRLLTTSGYLKCVQSNLHVAVSALVAASVVWMYELPSKLNPIILPLMASVKKEQEEILQNIAAEGLAELIYHCVGRKPGPNDKLIKNICSLTCMDPRETPQAEILNTIDIIEDQDLLPFGGTNTKQKPKANMLTSGEDRSRIEGFICRRGAEFALNHLCVKFGSMLFDKLPKLWDCLTEILKPVRLEGMTPEDEMDLTRVVDSIKDPQLLINNIQVVRSIAPMLSETLRPKLLTLLPCIFKCVRHPHVAVRLSASKCITSMAKSMPLNVMCPIIENVIPMLGDITSINARQGAGMLLCLLVQVMGGELVPYARLLVVPLLRCMSDIDHSVRRSVTHSFAALVPLLPLARGLPPPGGLSESLLGNTEDAQFLEQLVDNSNIEDYKLAFELKVTLRRYQQEGINWLAFLKRFNLHGILCDDMGLGKTLQASAILASDIVERRTANTEDPSSLIICPSTLVGHWVYEMEKFIDTSVLTSLQYIGSSQERISLRSHFHKYNVIVTSYDVVRKDIDYLSQLLWNYCVLDEGHIIKNSKSKITGAVKQLKAQHRLILSGTPIQNNVLDLWSLFDFLMPGFLGTDRQFQATYGKPLQAARDAKCSSKDSEAGVLAMEALHKQFNQSEIIAQSSFALTAKEVMPFLLRRTKDQVLTDLPEKIIQDRYCDLSGLQLKLYEKFSGSHVRQEISSMVKVNETGTGEGSAPSKATSHVFQALQYLLKLCSHPLLVLGEKNQDLIPSLLPDLSSTSSDIGLELHKLHHSPKLVALEEILEECGIGVDPLTSEGSVTVGQHRVLIFAQHKAFLDIIEKDLFRVHMKNVTYLRLDGSVEPEKRFDIVKSFNSDPTIDVLLLTTHVGGLGLNLTSADTLVFMEHDWNPMRDLQAMDRAHRLGQRKVVNVHRLIMRGTLEEKVMSLQKFKVSVANAVINAENASLNTMNTDQLLDLFTTAKNKKGAASSKSTEETDNVDGTLKIPGSGKGLKAILGGLEELWDQSQYTEEYNLTQFLAKLNG